MASSFYGEMVLFPMGSVLRGFRLRRRTPMYVSIKTLVRPCSSKKFLVSELEAAKVFAINPPLLFTISVSPKVYLEVIPFRLLLPIPWDRLIVFMCLKLKFILPLNTMH